ncbi:MAG: trigger factor [Terriglobia bacterium]
MAPESSTCALELEVEVPAEVVQRETERITREVARVARLPGFRPGKAPAPLVRRRYWENIKQEVLHALVPSSLDRALQEKSLAPVATPSIAELSFEPDQPLRYKATFEVLPEIVLNDYKGLEIEPAQVELTNTDVDRELEALRERAATFEPVEGRPAADGDSVVASLGGVVTDVKDKREPVVLDDAVVHLGAESTLDAFNQGLRGAQAGEEKQFSVPYPADYPNQGLAGHTVAFTATVKGVKRKKLPALDDDFAAQVSECKTLEELKKKLRQGLEKAKEAREKELTRQRLLDALLERHDFPLPEALVAQQMDRRLERQVRGLAAQGVDPQRADVDWRRVHRAGREGAQRETRLGLLLPRIAEAEKIEVSEDDLNQEIERLARGSGQTPEALRARLTKEDRLASIRSALRGERVVEFLLSQARLRSRG